VLSVLTAAEPSTLPCALTAAYGASSAPMKSRLPRLIDVACAKFQTTRLRQVALVNWLTMLPLVQFTTEPVTLMTMAVALPGVSSICCTSGFANRAFASTLKMAMPHELTAVTVNWAGPGCPEGSCTLLLEGAPDSAAAPFWSAAVMGPALSDESGMTMPPPLKLMMRLPVDPLMRKLPA
jgi:hypothetical protein